MLISFSGDNMDKTLCYGCMETINDEDTCPYCGHVKNNTIHSSLLNEGVILSGRFVIGKVLFIYPNSVTYLGYDKSLLQKILIVEYFPIKISERNSQYTVSVKIKDKCHEKYNTGLKNFIDEAIELTKQNGLSNLESAYQVLEINNTAYSIMEYSDKNLSFKPLSNVKKNTLINTNKKVRILVACFALLILIAVFISALTPDMVKMPKVTGMDYLRAQQTLESLGIDYDMVLAYSSRDYPDRIISQSIPEGTKIKAKNIVVKITRNYAFELPSVQGRYIESADEVLTKRGIAYKTTKGYNAEYNKGIVLSQEPGPGNLPVKDDFFVRLYVNDDVYMPDVTNMQYADAVKVLEELNIKFSINKIINKQEPGHRVVNQRPAPGEKVLNSYKIVALDVNVAISLPDLEGLNENQVIETLKYKGFSKINLTSAGSYIGLPGSFVYTDYHPGVIVISDEFINICYIDDRKIFIEDNTLASLIESVKKDITASQALNVKVLEYDGNGKSPVENLEGIQYFKNIKTLTMPNNKINDIVPLYYNPLLEYVDLSNNEIFSFAGVIYDTIERSYVKEVNVFMNLVNLKELNLSGNYIVNIYMLSSLTRLEAVDLSGNSIIDISSLTSLNELKSINLSNNDISELPEIELPVNLIELDLSYNSITDITMLSSLENLEILHLAGNLITDITPLGNLKNTGVLILDDNPVTDLTPLKNLETLYRLSLVGVPVSDYSPLKNLPGLEGLEIDGDGDFDDFEYIDNL